MGKTDQATPPAEAELTVEALDQIAGGGAGNVPGALPLPVNIVRTPPAKPPGGF
ncbi:hypothetical protein [Roseomonas sp. 18066]|uniref:hypothetical protein n=1 Tax=Roseomonas sp. 18066 TaxID=2681412 RepID=UPI001359EE79|nr:hypothetical protein [Roseomonas sp. 18066]